MTDKTAGELPWQVDSPEKQDFAKAADEAALKSTAEIFKLSSRHQSQCLTRSWTKLEAESRSQVPVELEWRQSAEP